jgi:hypothetical protein
MQFVLLFADYVSSLVISYCYCDTKSNKKYEKIDQALKVLFAATENRFSVIANEKKFSIRVRREIASVQHTQQRILG